jgi:hypothetical protein
MLAFVFAGLTSRKGLLSDPPCDDVVRSFNENLFSKITHEFHVYIVGDTDCYERACSYFGKERVIQCVNVPTTNNLKNFVNNPKPNLRWPEHINNVGLTNLFKKMQLTADAIKQEYDAIIRIRHDVILGDDLSRYIFKIISEPSVDLACIYDWVMVGKQNIIKYILNTDERGYSISNPTDFDTTSILTNKEFAIWREDSSIPSNAPELVFSNIVLDYYNKNGISPKGRLYHICMDFGRPYDHSHHEPHFLVLKNTSKHNIDFDLLNEQSFVHGTPSSQS